MPIDLKEVDLSAERVAEEKNVEACRLHLEDLHRCHPERVVGTPEYEKRQKELRS